MAVIKLVEPYAVAQLRKDVRDAMMLAGEQCVLLQLFHPGDKDAVLCPQCGDDTYPSPEADCTSCYGTRFDGGVRLATKVWALFTDRDFGEQIGQRGTYRADERSVTFEAYPAVGEHDVLVRVRSWSAQSTPLEVEGHYILQKVQRRSLRTGNRFGQWSWDVVSQKAQTTELNPHVHGITDYAVLGKVFLEPVITNG